MKLIGLRPARSGAGAIAYVDVESSPGVKLYGLRVSRSPDGNFRVFGPENAHGRTCAFNVEIANKIAHLTVAGMSQHERRIAS